MQSSSDDSSSFSESVSRKPKKKIEKAKVNNNTIQEDPREEDAQPNPMP